MAIHKTYDYNKFNLLKGNRVLDLNHVRSLKKSFLKDNRSELFPIVVDKNFNILDGQHRMKALQELELPIYYVISLDGDLDLVKTINTSVKGWGFEDFLESYIQLGNLDYQKYKEYRNHYLLKSSSALMICSESTSKDFKEGKFKFNDDERVFEIAKVFKEIKPYFIAGRDYILIAGLKHLFNHPKFNHKRLIDKFKEKSETYMIPLNVRLCVALLEDIYNTKLKKERINFNMK